MMVRDRQLKQLVDVVDKDCPKRTCYWPRQDPGSFSQGVGYRTRLNAKGGIDWLCGRREINGCPHPKPEPQTSARTKPTEGSIAR
jgi:hypothetical protein